MFVILMSCAVQLAVCVAAGKDDSCMDARVLGCEYANVCYISLNLHAGEVTEISPVSTTRVGGPS